MPLYETSEHLAEEEIMKKELEEFWDCKLEKLPTKYSLDYSICQGKNNNVIKGFVELKRRHELSTHHPDPTQDPIYFLDAHKLISAQNLWQKFRKPSNLVVKYNDRMGWVRIAGRRTDFSRNTLLMCGRKDRNDSNDFQPYLIIPQSKFKWIY